MADEDQLGREYVLHEELGRGAVAIVRRATSRLGGPDLVAKLLRPQFSNDRRIRDLFLREEAALRDLEHESIVGVRDLVVERGAVALVMEYVDGPNLRRHVADSGGTLPIVEAAGIVAQAATAMAAAHAQGVVHLDLKPENILVVRGTDPTTIKVTDFGIAALLLDDDRGGAAVLGGTPGYTAPEVSGDGPATAAADIYSLGVVLGEIVAGVRPNASAGDLAKVPSQLRALVESCLATDPRERPSARSLAAQLRRVGPGAVTPAAAEPTPRELPEHADTAVPHKAEPVPQEIGSAPLETQLRQPRIRPVVDAPAPQPPGNDKSRRKQLLAVGAAFVAVAAALIGINVKSAANEQPAGAPAVTVTSVSAATSAVSVPPTPTSSLQKLAAANPVDYPRATYAAHLPDGAGSLYLAMRDGEAIAYLCDGRKIEAWFDGTAVAGKLTLTGKKGSTLTGSFDSARATGKVVVGGKTVSFTIPVVHKPSGLYRAATQVRNADVQGGWIVLADGSQVGVVTIDGTPQPAPALDTVGRTATIDGTTVSASEIDIDSGSGF